MTDTHMPDTAQDPNRHRSRELARDRTELAEDRTVLAHERSFASWLRTGMAAVAIGLGFHAIFKAVEPTWAGKAIASAFLLIAIAIFYSAQRRARGVLDALAPNKVVALKPIRIRALSFALMGATLALMLAIWFFIDS